ncbi:MAG: Virginiamycin B lyase [Nitrosopumilus sp.]|nr:Virginiamycin B lyase [Nitrosopumilus sp.]
MVKKSIYIIIGIIVLIFFAVLFVVLDEPDKTQNDVSKIENNISEISEPIKQIELTGTPADKYAPHERDQHCGGSDFKSNQYIQEFEIPTPCSQPLSIVTDSEEKIWFMQSNTGNMTMFDPTSGEFTEYPNDQWTSKVKVMMWGIYYTQDDEIWYTDEGSGSLWKFSIPEKTYTQFEIPSKTNKSFPQKIAFYEDNFVINDFTGNQVVILNHKQLDEGIATPSIISVPEGFFTSQAAVDSDGNIWFVMWKYQKDAILVKTNSNTQELEQFTLPVSIKAPNGVSVGPLDNVWIADTAGDSFYRFIPSSKLVTEFVTSDPPIWTFGNSTGLIKTPISRPYWNAFDSDGNMWFNQQTANRLAVFNPNSESLIEYDIPSKNPGWADCGDISDCGTAQSFGFAIQGKQVWFTEWVENNIGVLDTSVSLPILISIDENEIEIKQGQQKEIFVTVSPKTNQNLEITLFGNSNSESITVKPQSETAVISNESVKLPVTIITDENIHKGYYKILIGTQFSDVAISSYATIKIV